MVTLGPSRSHLIFQIVCNFILNRIVINLDIQREISLWGCCLKITIDQTWQGSCFRNVSYFQFRECVSPFVIGIDERVFVRLNSWNQKKELVIGIYKSIIIGTLWNVMHWIEDLTNISPIKSYFSTNLMMFLAIIKMNYM